MKVLVTGGLGFIGSNLVDKLISEGYDTDIVDDLSNGEKAFANVHCSNVFVCDFVDDSILSKIKKQKYDCVFHLAAKPRVGYSVDFPYLSNETNVSKTVKLLEACKNNVSRFINTSSSSVYGDAKTLPTSEIESHKPASPYALQKSITEQYCNMFSLLYGLDTVSVRPFNVFGPNQKAGDAYSTAVSSWLKCVKDNKPLRFDGTGEQSRDMIHVDDVVNIFYKCMRYKSKFNGEAFNAGTGISTSNKRIFEWFKSKFGNISVNYAPFREGDVMHTLASIDKAHNDLGYIPTRGFFEGLESTCEWAMNSMIF